MPGFFTKAISHDNFYRLLVVGILGSIATIHILQALNGVLPPFIVSCILAYLLNGLVEKLERLKFTRGLAAAFIIITFLVFISVMIFVALPYLQRELVVLAENLPQFVSAFLNSLSPVLERVSTKMGNVDPALIKEHINHYLGDIFQWGLQIFINVLTSSFAIANLISLTILTPIITFYLLKDWPYLIKQITILLPKQYATTICQTVQNVDKALIAFLKGQIAVSLALMILYMIALWLVGLHQAVFVGLLMGILSFIPLIGLLIGYVVCMGIAFSQFSDWTSIACVASVYFIVPLIDANFLTPNFIGGKIGLHPVWILFALLAGGNLFGFAGALFALPMAAIASVLVRSIREHCVVQDT
ncbi:MAG: AI-2E family transporter [Alphaproteobacteria bacterium]|nr:AI-2E family transporter [Alphaproteobacteria bacterium]